MTNQRYTWDSERGVLDSDGRQAVQLVGAAPKFRQECGVLLVAALNLFVEPEAATIRQIFGKLLDWPDDDLLPE